MSTDGNAVHKRSRTGSGGVGGGGSGGGGGGSGGGGGGGCGVRGCGDCFSGGRSGGGGGGGGSNRVDHLFTSDDESSGEESSGEESSGEEWAIEQKPDGTFMIRYGGGDCAGGFTDMALDAVFCSKATVVFDHGNPVIKGMPDDVVDNLAQQLLCGWSPGRAIVPDSRQPGRGTVALRVWQALHGALRVYADDYDKEFKRLGDVINGELPRTFNLFWVLAIITKVSAQDVPTGFAKLQAIISVKPDLMGDRRYTFSYLVDKCRDALIKVMTTAMTKLKAWSDAHAKVHSADAQLNGCLVDVRDREEDLADAKEAADAAAKKQARAVKVFALFEF